MSQTEVQLIKDAVIVNADVSNSAAIDVSKISGAMPLTGGTFTDDVTFDGATAGRDIVFDRSDNAFEFADDVQIRIGTGNDLTIFHESSSNFNVFRQNNALNTKWLAGSDTVARFMTNGAVELYHDNSKKLETTSTGIAVTGSVIPTGNVNLGDSSNSNNNRFICGASDDLQLYHDASDSIISNSAGVFFIQNAGDLRLRVNNTEAAVHCVTNGAVELYHNGNKKLETTSTGTNVTSANDAVLQVTTTGSASTDDARIELITQESTFTIQNDRSLGTDGALTISPGTEAGINIYKDAQVELYFNNSQKVATFADGLSVSTQIQFKSTFTGTPQEFDIRLDTDGRLSFDRNGDDTTPCLILDDDNDGRILIPDDNQKLLIGAGQDLELYHDGTNSYVTTNTGQIYLRSVSSNAWLRCNEGGILSTDGNEYLIRATTNGSVKLFHDNSKKFETSSTGATVTGTITATQFTYASHPGSSSFTGNNSTTTFTILSGHNVNSILVIYNGAVLTPTTDYTINGTTMTMQFTPLTNSEIVVRYLPN